MGKLSHREASIAPGPQWEQNSLDLGAAGLPGIPEAHDTEPGQINPAGERCWLGLGTLGEGCAAHFRGCLRAEMV